MYIAISEPIPICFLFFKLNQSHIMPERFNVLNLIPNFRIYPKLNVHKYSTADPKNLKTQNPWNINLDAKYNKTSQLKDRNKSFNFTFLPILNEANKT